MGLLMGSDLSTPKILKRGGPSALLRHIQKLFLTLPFPPMHILVIAFVFLLGMMIFQKYAFWFQNRLLGRSLVCKI